MLFLQKYDFRVDYIPGKDMIIADALSRAQSSDVTPELTENEIKSYIHSIIINKPISDRKLESIKKETEKDTALKMVTNYIRQGWPDKREKVIDTAKPYFNIRSDLTTIDGIIMKGSRIVIPSSLQKEMKRTLHTGHIGIEKTKARARDTIYWPNIDNELTDLISNCATCLEYRNKQQKEPLIQHEIPIIPWTKVGTDLFECFNKDYLIIVDYTSKFFEISELHHNTHSSTIVNHTKSIFARHGIPYSVISDNGPQYISSNYK
jgi:hypothetical protein